MKQIETTSREEWLAARRGRVTSSVVAGVLGASPWMTPLEAWLSITGRSDFEGNAATIRGTRLEATVLDYPLSLNPALTRAEAPFIASEWSGDSADCLYLGADGKLHVGEAKTVAMGSANDWGPDGSDDVPEHVAAQSLWHLAHWPEAQECIVPVLIGGYAFEFRQYVVRRDDDLIGEMMEYAERWHRDHVLTDMPPAAEAGDDASVTRAFPIHSAGEWVEPSEELEMLANDYARARDAKNHYDAEKSAAAARIRQILGKAEGSKGARYKITWKNVKDSLRVDWEALARELGATDRDIQRHTRTVKGHRTLRVTLPKSKENAA